MGRVNSPERKMKNKKAFTLVEILIAMVLLGIGVIAMVRAGAAFTDSNKEGIDMTTAQFLAEQARERSAMMSFNELSSWDPNSVILGVDAGDVNDLSGYTQDITVEYVDPNDFSNVLDSGTSDFIKVTVTVIKDSKDVIKSSWIRARH